MLIEKLFTCLLMGLVMLAVGACAVPPDSHEQTDGVELNPLDYGGGERTFKVPLPPGYDWEVTQSWAEHCTSCSNEYHDWGDYCGIDFSHRGKCCKYAWDFNLPGSSDLGKPVLASREGVVDGVGYKSAWGNYVRIDHGRDICTLYAHMKDGSTDHISEGQEVCQGLKIGEIGDTGYGSEGAHLHFHFENCGTWKSIEMSFTDGNGIPVCTRGNDVYNSSGDYDFLKLSNIMVEDCGSEDVTFGGGELSEGGWISASCGNLPGCPLIPNCGRGAGHQFSDHYSLTTWTAEAGAYLYSECALDGKSNGKLEPLHKITRAEALKIPLFLFGLMGNCGSWEPFADVDQGDWYFSVVACAVKHGIVDTVADYFQPNSTVTFAEAAKFVVEAASKAGVINVKNPSKGHFSYISKSHWAYRYVETIHAYGGIDSSALYYFPDRKLARREYIVMVASLSPCFCRNVDCIGGCVCDQSVFACVDPDDVSAGTGGEDPDDGPDGDPTGSGDDPDDPQEKEFDLEIACSILDEKTECISPSTTVLYIKCAVSNHGDEVVKINNLVMSMEDVDAASGCIVTDPDMKKGGVSTKNVESGETETLSGHFEISCLSKPSYPYFDLLFDLIERVTGEGNTLYEDLLQTEVIVPDEPFAMCEPPDDPVDPCVPDCAGKECGPDFCGGYCAFCPGGWHCDTDTWKCAKDGGADPPDDPVDPPDDPADPPDDPVDPPDDPVDPPDDPVDPPDDPVDPPDDPVDPPDDPCPSCPAGTQCVDEKCVSAPWTCDPSVGYKVFLKSPGGSFEILTSGPVSYFNEVFPPGMNFTATFDCIDLPSVILMHEGPAGMKVALDETFDPEEFPPFAVWISYSGELVIDPPYPFDVTTHSISSTNEAGFTMLVRIPAD